MEKEEEDIFEKLSEEMQDIILKKSNDVRYKILKIISQIMREKGFEVEISSKSWKLTCKKDNLEYIFNNNKIEENDYSESQISLFLSKNQYQSFLSRDDYDELCYSYGFYKEEVANEIVKNTLKDKLINVEQKVH